MNTGLIGNREKAIIHIAKQQLGMSEEEYRAILSGFGVDSSKNLTYPQFEKFMKILKSTGFAVKSKGKPCISLRKTTWDKDPLLRKIGSLLTRMKLSWNYADGIARRMFKVDSVCWCVPDQLHKIVAALEYKRRRIELN